MRMDQLSGFTTFYAVARNLSFAKAALELRVTAPAVSQQIQALEERMQTRLFQRTTRTVSLTDAGRSLLGRIEPALLELMDATEHVQGLNSEPAGLLRINAPAIAIAMFIQPRLVAFLKKYPKIDIELYRDDAFSDIVAQRFDIGLRLGEFLQKDMYSRRLSEFEETAIVASPSYLKRHGAPTHPRDLLEHRCIPYRLHSAHALYRWEFEDDGNELLIDPKGPLTVNDPALAVEAAKNGIGVAYTIASFVEEHVRKGRLVRVLESYSPRYPGFHFYYNSRKHLPPKMSAFLDFFSRS